MNRKAIFIALGIIALMVKPAAAIEYELTQEEAQTVKRIMAQDKLLNKMAKDQEGLELLARLLSTAIRGPIKIAVTWNLAAIRGWRTANDRLARIGKLVICADLMEQISTSTTNRRFFEDMSDARGCNDL